MRRGFAHGALIELAADADQQAPGAAVTVALCGHWEHAGTCRWPHRTSVVTRSGPSLRVRVVFAAAPDEEIAVRRLISDALDQGRLDTEPQSSRWTVTAQGPAGLSAAEARLADRIG
jgi:hypothetical protein